MDLYIDGFKGNEKFHVNITEFKKEKRYEVDLYEFVQILNKSKLRVYSDFAEAIYLKGNINHTEVEITVTEIEDISVKF